MNFFLNISAIMRQNILIILFVFFCFGFSYGQKMPDKILITENAGYSWNIQQRQFVLQENELFLQDSLSKLHFISFISKEKYMNLVNEIYKSGCDSLNINLFNIDSTGLKKNVKKNIKKNYSKKFKNWSNEERQFVIKELSDISNYNLALGRIIRLDDSYIIHQGTSKIVELSLIYENDTVTLKSNPLGLGFRIPWTFEKENKASYNFGISNALLNILKNKWLYKEPQPSKKKLTNEMVKEIFDSKCKYELYKISPKQFSKELQELEDYFTIKNAVEHGSRGRYIGNTPQVFKVTLKNDLMKQGVFIQYFITRQGKTLYPRVSIINNYKQLISRAQSIDFLMDFISEDTARAIDIYYFDNKGINDYLIDGFNKNPKEWKKYEADIEGYKWYEKYNIQPSFDIDKAMKTSELLYCGCNFRYDNNYLQKAIMFELRDEFNNASIWFLLPDDTAILYHFSGDRCYKYDYKEYGTNGGSVQDACVKFDKQGNMIKRENK
jgi:hypothetical protein